VGYVKRRFLDLVICTAVGMEENIGDEIAVWLIPGLIKSFQTR
jgi:hypothetical protein